MKTNYLPSVLQGLHSDNTLQILTKRYPWCGILHAIRVKNNVSSLSTSEFKELLKQAAIRMPFRENLYYLLQDNKPIVTENLSAQEWKPVEVWDNQVNLPTELIKQLEDKQSEQEEVNEAIDSVNMGLESADVSLVV